MQSEAIVTMKEIMRRLKRDDNHIAPAPWVDSESIVGFDRESAFDDGKRDWFSVGSDALDLSDSPIEIIPDYMSYVLEGLQLAQSESIPGETLLIALLWLVEVLGSSYAVTVLLDWRGRVNDVPLEWAFRRILATGRRTREAFVRDIIRELLWDFFDVGRGWADWRERLLEEGVSSEVVEALEGFTNGGYETIDNSDVRRWNDGTSRW